MLDALNCITVPDQSFWIVCAAFYLLDNAGRHAGRELLLIETFRRRWTLLRPIHRYRLRGQAVTLLPPWFPFLAAVRLGWLCDDAAPSLALRRTRRLLKFHQRRLAPFRVLSSAYFIVLFVIGPVATYRAGLTYALLLVIPFHAVGLILISSSLITSRHIWRMDWRQLASLVFECAVCPGCSANICRKLSLGYLRVPGDAIAVAIDQDKVRTVASLSGGLMDMMLDDLAEHGELQSEDSHSIESYRARLIDADCDV